MYRGLARLLFVVAILAAPFAVLPWPAALLVIMLFNAGLCLTFAIVGRLRLTERLRLATSNGAAALLIFATLYFTDWGFSSLNPSVHVAWPYLIAACVSEVAMVVSYVLPARPPLETSGGEL
jgi:hypothetical protein